MAEFIVDPRAASFEQARTLIEDYIQNKPNFSTWEEFYSSGAGQTVVELIAGLLVYQQYNNIVGRRESYMEYAQNLSSGRAIANVLGYSATRGRNPVVTISMLPQETKTYLKYEVIGQVGDRDLICLQDTPITNGVAVSFDAIVGTISEETIISPGSTLNLFRFKSSTVSEDLALLLDNVEISYTEKMLDLINNNYVVITNGFGAVNVYYLNQAAPFYSTGTELKIRFVNLEEFTVLPADVQFFDDGLTLVVIKSSYQPPEDIESVRVNAPLYYETQFVIRGRNDYRKIIKTLLERFIDSSARDFSPTVVEVSYLTRELTAMTPSEESEVSSKLLSYRPFGVAPAIISPPIRADLALTVVVNLKGTQTENYNIIVEAALAAYEEKLNPRVDLWSIENYIESNSTFDKIARVLPKVTTWGALTSYSRLSHVTPTTPSDYVFFYEKQVNLSGAVQPAFTEVPGDEIEDNHLIWEVIQDERANLNNWQANTSYKDGDVVKSTLTSQVYSYKVKTTVEFSGATQPIWPTTSEQVIIDNDLMWMCTDIVGSPATWTANTKYRIGQSVIPTVPNGKMYQVVKYSKKSLGVEPVWPVTENAIIVSGRIQWKSKKIDTPLLITEWNEYMKLSTEITVNFGSGT